MNPIYAYIWEKVNIRQAILLRLYGKTPNPVLPETICENKLIGIGDYCFAEAEHFFAGEKYLSVLDEDGSRMCEQISDMSDIDIRLHQLGLVKICGSVPEKVILPEGIQRLGSLAFYNCTSLHELEIGAELSEIGSDAFMNCRRLHRIRVRAEVTQKTAAQRILAQISSDMEIQFIKYSDNLSVNLYGENLYEAQDRIEAQLLYPEYYESYDEIAPAHLFGRNIEGEGFRARQCFIDGRIDFDAYDKIFKRACIEESERTLSTFAMNRLRYPVSLKEESYQNYLQYIKEHIERVAVGLVQNRELEQLRFLSEEKLFTPQLYEKLICHASKCEWTEGVAELMHRKQADAPPSTEARYTFDDF